jgi:RNA polymerase sigma-70 factor (ECF subfamily)
MGNERMVDMAPSGGTARAKNNPGVLYGCLLGHADENRQGFQNHTYIPHIPKIAGLTIGAAIHQTRMVSLAEDGLFLADKGRNRASVDGGALGPLTALAREALGQEPEKVRRFLEAIAPTVRRTCRGVLGYAHPDLEDAIQESLMDLVRALPHYRFEADVSHYAARIALRVAIAERSKDRDRVQHLRLFHQSHASRPPSMDAPSAVSNVECSRLVSLIIRKLKRSQAEAVLLRFFLGCSVEEVAATTGVSLNTVKTRLRLGKDKLRRHLEKQGYSPETAGVFR